MYRARCRQLGIDPDGSRKSRRNVIRVLKKVDGRYEQVSFGRVVDGKRIDIRVRGGCRIIAPQSN
jgi:hypothetical protein